jgi:CheY-like chemotaxis protein
MGPFDVVVCRNVLIYFSDETAKRVLQSLTATLRGGGALFVGVSESLLRFGTPLNAKSAAACPLLEGALDADPRARSNPGLGGRRLRLRRKVVREILSASPRIKVIDIARDGLEALEKSTDLKPDVVTLDLVMPHLDGIGVLQALPKTGGPRVDRREHLRRRERAWNPGPPGGAVEIVHKPTALATEPAL